MIYYLIDNTSDNEYPTPWAKFETDKYTVEEIQNLVDKLKEQNDEYDNEYIVEELNKLPDIKATMMAPLDFEEKIFVYY